MCAKHQRNVCKHNKRKENMRKILRATAEREFHLWTLECVIKEKLLLLMFARMPGLGKLVCRRMNQNILKEILRNLLCEPFSTPQLDKQKGDSIIENTFHEPMLVDKSPLIYCSSDVLGPRACERNLLHPWCEQTAKKWVVCINWFGKEFNADFPHKKKHVEAGSALHKRNFFFGGAQLNANCNSLVAYRGFTFPRVLLALAAICFTRTDNRSLWVIFHDFFENFWRAKKATQEEPSGWIRLKLLES